jgi:hypothetical protein
MYQQGTMTPIKVAPELSPYARKIVMAYDETPGSSGPYANPDSLAAVLDHIADVERMPRLREIALQLRGG